MNSDQNDPAQPQNPMPKWVPEAARQYLQHVGDGTSVRAVARHHGMVPSTISRRMRRIESRMDDPLLHEALMSLAADADPSNSILKKENWRMTAPIRTPIHDETLIAREARRIWRRLCETGAVLAVAQDLDKAVVVRESDTGEQTRTAVLDRRVAQAFAVKDWITCLRKGRIARYGISQAGKMALKRLIEEDRKRRTGMAGFAEGPSVFQGQHANWGKRQVAGDAGAPETIRVNLSESPLAKLAGRKGPDGKKFLSPDLIQAGEKLREDFERAQMGPRVGQNWERFLTGGDRGGFLTDGGIAEGPRAARQRVSDALDALGAALADVVLRVCCFLGGLESAARRRGWSARAGQVVLKIGLQRLLQHYQETQ